MATWVINPEIPSEPGKGIPPLETGDRLTRSEFERRYAAMPRLKKAELLEGVVYLPMHMGKVRYGVARADLIGWLGSYRTATPGVSAAAHVSLRLDRDNEPQPDAVLTVDQVRGGQSRVSPDDFLEGAPELIAEVVANRAALALHSKLHVYQRNGVREYLVWRVLDQQLDWFVLHGSQYELVAPNAAGFYQSEVFPGLWLDPAALLGLDLATVFRVLRQGLASPEHAAFVTKLQHAAAGKP